MKNRYKIVFTLILALGAPAAVFAEDAPAAQGTQSLETQLVPEAPETKATKETTAPAVPVTAPAPATKTAATDQPVFLDQKPAQDEVAQENERYIRLTREMEKAQQKKTEEETLKLLTEELAARQAELGQIQKNLSQTVSKKTEDNENLRLLITLYESMKADEVSALLKRLPMPLTVTIVKMMNPKKASKIIAAMDASMAAQVSRLLIQLPQPQPQVASKGVNP